MPSSYPMNQLIKAYALSMSSYFYKLKSSQVSYLNTKEMITDIIINIMSDSIQMKSLHSNANLIIYIVANCIVDFPDFDNIDDPFIFFIITRNIMTIIYQTHST